MSLTKQQLRKLGLALLHRGGVFSAFRKFERPRVSFLMYHGLTNRPLTAMEAAMGLHAPVAAFESVCQFLSESKLAMSMEEAVAILQNKVPARHGVVVTFDDGYRSNHDLAFPILQKHRVPATIFLATEFVHSSGNLWPDRVSYALEHALVDEFQLEMRDGLRAFRLTSTEERIRALQKICAWLKSLPQEQLLQETVRLENLLGRTLATASVPDIYQPIRWQQATAMQESGLVEFGAHTHHHRILSRCSPESIDRELSVNVELMEAHLGRRPRYFAYPNGQEGDFNGMTRQVLAKFGFQAAVTTVEGGNHAGSTDLLALQRYGEGSSPAQVEFLASGLQNKLKDRSPRAETAAEAHGKAATI